MEAGEQEVVIWNLIGVDRRDIAMWRMIVAAVGRIGLLRELVPLRGEHAVSPDRVEAFANAAHASEKVDEVEQSCTLFRRGGDTASAYLTCGLPGGTLPGVQATSTR